MSRPTAPTQDGLPRRIASSLRAGIVAVVFWGAGATVPATAADPLVLGAGPLAGVQYAVGGAVARVLSDTGVARTGVETTNGASENLIRVANRDLDLGLSPSHRLHSAHHGFGEFAGENRLASLVALAPLYAEPLVVAVRSGDGISALDGLKGRRIGLGDQASDHRALVETVLSAFGFTDDDLSASRSTPLNRQLPALCRGDLDAMIFTSAQPSGSVAAVLDACDTALLPLDGPAVDGLLTGHPHLVRATIPGTAYAALSGDIASVGPVVALFSRRDLPAHQAVAIRDSLAVGQDTLAAQLRMMPPADLPWPPLLDLGAPRHPALAPQEETPPDR